MASQHHTPSAATLDAGNPGAYLPSYVATMFQYVGQNQTCDIVSGQRSSDAPNRRAPSAPHSEVVGMSSVWTH